ncbi:transmembrane protein 160 [Corythoichthys intestinalis]|uniref:transmembrane protein 160 n=1 Tax=Corythoichthys intestinalis TaxID=161448 RepID=UPI0025A4D24F|nr:transmembrane protein 160 [Corythoichthys intestinalis]XP_061796995.1 transmembrane protein 160-like [Nerophis lumbriciformis]
MAFLRLFMRRQLPMTASQLSRVVLRLSRSPGGGLPDTTRRQLTEKGPWGKNRLQEPPQQYQLSDLDKADASMLRKSHETGFLSWFRNGLLATGIGVIAFVQSEVGREAAYAFFILGGACVSFGAASYVGSLLSLRKLMLLSVPAVLIQGAVVGSVALFWLCAVSLYIGRLEVEIIHEDDEEGEECQECRDRREHRGYRGPPHDRRHHDDGDGKGIDK